MDWFIVGLFFAFFNALTMLINAYFKLNGHLVSGLRGLGVALIYSPLLFFVKVPTNSEFWLLVVFEGFLSAYFNSRIYSSSAIYGAAATSMISVLSIGIGVVFWWIFDYNRFFELLDKPLSLIGIMASLAVLSWGFWKMAISSGGSFPKGAFRFMMPAVVLLAVMLIIRKELMLAVNFHSAAVYYACISIFISGILNLGYYIYKNGSDFLSRKVCRPKIAKAGFSMACASAAMIFFGNLASLTVPNPAYLNALTLTSPLWIFGINYLFGTRGSISLIAAASMLLGLFSLLYFGG